jgi:hypothetical protein
MAAPKARPMAIHINKYMSSSGSLIADRKRTIDNAPTSPRERASEDLTTKMTIVVVTVSSGKRRANESWFDTVLLKRLYSPARKKAARQLSVKPMRRSGMLAVEIFCKIHANVIRSTLFGCTLTIGWGFISKPVLT